LAIFRIKLRMELRPESYVRCRKACGIVN